MLISRQALSQLKCLRIRRSANFMHFMNIDRRIFKLRSFERAGRVLPVSPNCKFALGPCNAQLLLTKWKRKINRSKNILSGSHQLCRLHRHCHDHTDHHEVLWLTPERSVPRFYLARCYPTGSLSPARHRAEDSYFGL